MLKTLFVTTLSLTSLVAQADVKNELRRYYKCYGQLVRSVPNMETDTLISDIKNKKKTGTQACMEILGLADFVGNQLVDDSKLSTRKSVLKTMNDFHRNWFYTGVDENSGRCSTGSADVHDTGMMSYYLTKSLFSSDYKFKNVATADTLLEAIRYSVHPPQKRLLENKTKVRKFISGYPHLDSDGKSLTDVSKRFDEIELPVNQLGELIGIKEKSSLTVNTGGWNPEGALDADQLANGIPIFKNLGAGAVTTPTYIISNHKGGSATGALHVPRLWSKSLIKDLLCRDIPVVRTTDAIAYVDKDEESTLPFRAGVSCMQCHTSMDQIARIGRGVRRVNLAKSCNSGEGANVTVVTEHGDTISEMNSEEAHGTWIDKSDKNFYKRPKTGKFYFRTADGELIDKDVNGLNQLGDIIAETNDLYYCASKRYLQFFTSIDVPMFDSGDISSPKVSVKEQGYIDLVKSLGKELKENQNAKEIIRKIISSDYYINPLGEVSSNE